MHVFQLPSIDERKQYNYMKQTDRERDRQTDTLVMVITFGNNKSTIAVFSGILRKNMEMISLGAATA